MPSLLVAGLTGIIGLMSAGFIANACVGWYHISSREGKSGYFVVGLALLGGIVSTFVGLLVAHTSALGGLPGFASALLRSAGGVLGAAGVITLLCYLLADLPPTLNGCPLRLEVEFRLPAGHSKPNATGSFVLASVVNNAQRAAQQGQLKTSGAREEGGRWIIPGEASVFTKRGQRVIRVRLGDGDVTAFLIPLPARPGAAQEIWSDWLPHSRDEAQPWPDSQTSYRFRIQRISNP